MDNTSTKNVSEPAYISEISALKERFLPYLAEVRKRIVFTLSVFVVASIGGFIFNEPIIKLLIRALSLEGINIVFTSPFQFINLAFACGIATGVIVVLPLLLTQVLLFLKPALSYSEFKKLTKYLPVSIVLFIIGFSFGAMIMKWQIEIFLTRAVSLGIGNILDISGLLSTVFLTSALLGLGFQFPLVLLLLMRFDIVKHASLSKKRPWVYLGSFIFTLFLPPDSILADVILSLPLITLYELTLLANRLNRRGRV